MDGLACRGPEARATLKAYKSARKQYSAGPKHPQERLLGLLDGDDHEHDRHAATHQRLVA